MKKVCGVSIISIVIMLYAMALLQCAECQDVGQQLSRCHDKVRSAERDMKSKLKREEDGSLSLDMSKGRCPSPVKKLNIWDCRCLYQENARNADIVLDKEKQQRLEFLDLINSNTQIAKSCNFKTDCSDAADKVIRSIFPEKNTPLENGLRKRHRRCTERARQVVPSCRSYIDMVKQTNSSDTAVQGDDAAQKACCDALSVAMSEEDCLCLILEADKAKPNAPKPAIEKQMIEVLKFVNADEGRTRNCVTNIQKLDCSGVAKALSLGNADKDLQDPRKCDKAAVDAMETCAATLEGMGPGNADTVQSLACCNELQRIGGAGCGCSLGNSVPTSKEVAGFLESVRGRGDKLVKSCPGFKLEGVLNCPKATTGNKNPKLFDKCELDAQQAMKTCAPLAKKAVPDQSSCEMLERFSRDPCACAIQDYCSRNMSEGNYMFCESFSFIYYRSRCYNNNMKNNTQFISSCMDKFNATRQACADEKAHPAKKPKVDPPIQPCCPPGKKKSGCVECDSETMSCCQQLAALSTSSTGEVDSCLCQVIDKRVTGRTDTTTFLKAHALRDQGTATSAVLQTCNLIMPKTFGIDCVRVSGASGTDPAVAAYLYRQEATERRLKWKLTH